MHIAQHTMTLAHAASIGMFDDPRSEFAERDWKGRAERRPLDVLYVYTIGQCVIGWVDGEEADYSSLVEFEQQYDAAFADLWTWLQA